MRNGQKTWGLLAGAAAFVSALVWMSGCTAKAVLPVSVFYPATPTPLPTCGLLLNGCETLAENGNWSGTKATRALTTLHATQGSNAISATLTSWASWNDQILVLDSFANSNFTGYPQLKADVYADPGLVGGSYTQLVLVGDSAAAGKYYCMMSVTPPNLVAGQQTITWNLDNWGPGATQIPYGQPLSKLMFVLNTGASGGTGAGYSLTLDNIRLVAPCGTPTPTPSPVPPTPTFTPNACGLLFNDWETLSDNGTLTPANMTNATASLSTQHVVRGTHSLDLNITATSSSGWNDKILYLSGFTPAVLSGYTTMQADIYVDGNILANAGYPPQLMLFADATGNTYKSIAAGVVLTGGTQHVTWTLDWSNIPSGTPLTGLFLIINRDAGTVGVSGLGHFYIDNMRLCP